ncbi:MAG: DoxX family protein [Rhodothermales bacterium]|nr:DoxX family protein [Rhodothermales bacterium]MBO6781454.1 DoxX family protein [Rhodothermales bacterium]
MSPKTKSIVGWVLRGLLAVMFVAAASGKVMGVEDWFVRFENWGLPSWMVYVTGVMELAGAIGLLIPKLAQKAALLLIVVMIGAAGTHARAGEWASLPVNAAYIAVLVGIIYLLKPAAAPAE